MSSGVIICHTIRYFTTVYTVIICKVRTDERLGTSSDGQQHAAHVAQQSAGGGFSVQTNRASCVLYDRKYSAIQKPTCPPNGREISSKVGKSDGERKITQKQKSMEKKQARRTGRKPKTDPADYKYNFRLNAQEKSRFERLFLESGARDRTIFIKKSIFSEQLKVIKVDKVSMDYYIRLGEFYRQFQTIGNNYNQVVRAVQKNFGEKRAMSLLYKLEKATLELILLNKQIMALTKEYEKKWLQR